MAPTEGAETETEAEIRSTSSYTFINIKLAAYHLLLYVVYLCQKS